MDINILENIAGAVTVIYDSGSTPEKRAEAQNFLNEFQKLNNSIDYALFLLEKMDCIFETIT